VAADHAPPAAVAADHRLQRRSGPVDMHALCLPLHGEKHDPRAHEDAVMTHHDGDATRPRVQHPMNDWARIITDAMQPEIQALREKCGEQSPSRRPLIGVGHSLGASILWATEVRSPGTFDGLVLFEPILGESTPAYEKLVDFLMDLTLPRAQKWCVDVLAPVLKEALRL
jgi:alpha-beta hydrolase superfamily lysophospholipase